MTLAGMITLSASSGGYMLSSGPRGAGIAAVEPSVRALRAPHAGMQVEAPTRISDISKQMQEARLSLEENEQTRLYMQALRGTNMNDDAQAASDTKLQVVEMRRGEGDDVLPTSYQPEQLGAYFKKRPGAVLTRIGQIFSTTSGWFVGTLIAKARGMESGSPEEVERVQALRGIIVSLGPFFIKLGQALSIRPDILSPQAMVEMQQLCDKVPAFDTGMAMATLEDELGMKVNDIFSEIPPEPVAAASLGQVYKATLRENGEVVAVKVQRPFVLETVSLDLYLARSLGELLRNTPLTERVDIV